MAKHEDPALLECPFCGGAGAYKLKQYGGTGASGMEPHTILAGCSQCNVFFSGGEEQGWTSERRWFDRSSEAYATAAKRWNRRAT